MLGFVVLCVLCVLCSCIAELRYKRRPVLVRVDVQGDGDNNNNNNNRDKDNNSDDDDNNNNNNNIDRLSSSALFNDDDDSASLAMHRRLPFIVRLLVPIAILATAAAFVSSNTSTGASVVAVVRVGERVVRPPPLFEFSLINTGFGFF